MVAKDKKYSPIQPSNEFSHLLFRNLTAKISQVKNNSILRHSFIPPLNQGFIHIGEAGKTGPVFENSFAIEVCIGRKEDFSRRKMDLVGIRDGSSIMTPPCCLLPLGRR